MNSKHKGAVGSREARRRAGRGGFDTARQHATENRLAFVWHGLPEEPRCQGTVWIHVDGTCECDSESCGGPFAAWHPLPARHACGSDKPVKGQCVRCARESASLPPQIADPLFWVNAAKRFLPADQRAVLDGLLQHKDPAAATAAADGDLDGAADGDPDRATNPTTNPTTTSDPADVPGQ